MFALPDLPFDPFTALFTLGVLHTLMPLTVWALLPPQHNRHSTWLWCGASVLTGASFLLLGLRHQWPEPLSRDLANAMGCLGFAMRWAALRLDVGQVPRRLPLWSAVLVAVLGYALALQLGRLQAQSFSLLCHAVGAALVAHQALQLCTARPRSRSVRMIAYTYGAFALALAVRAALLLGGAQPLLPQTLSLDTAALLLTCLLAAGWGNLGYLGFVLDRQAQQEASRGAELAAAQARGELAERQALALKQLSDEREELLRVISHEARQPLHNAQAVLQGVDGVLQAGLVDTDAAALRISRARTVLRQITASLDNTLAASTLLITAKPATLRETDLDMMVALCLGDLPPSGRARVQVLRDSEARTAEMEIGLMRLALRNLLNNALAYATPDTPVLLRIADSDEPLALVLEVVDQGPGIAEALLPKVFERGTRGRLDVHGQGLGLFIVRRALQRQGGTVAVRSSATGTTFTLVLPQGQDPGLV